MREHLESNDIGKIVDLEDNHLDIARYRVKIEEDEAEHYIEIDSRIDIQTHERDIVEFIEGNQVKLSFYARYVFCSTDGILMQKITHAQGLVTMQTENSNEGLYCESTAR